MASRSGGGSIHVVDNSVVSINEAVRQLMEMIDELRGLRGTVTFYSPITIQTTVGGDTFTTTINPAGDTIITQDTIIAVYNSTGSTIVKGTPVYVSGAYQGFPTIAPADADDTTKMPAIGLTQDAIPDASFGNVINWGVLNDVDTSSFAAGDILYVSTSAGGKTTTAPAGNIRQRIGVVAVADASTGRIVVGIAGTDVRHRLLGDHHTDTSGAAAATGDLIYANSTPAWTKLPIGSDAQALIVSGGLPTWGSVTSSEATDVSNVEAGGSEQEFEKIIAGTGLTLTELANGSAIKLDASAAAIGRWDPDAPPDSAGADDDEFADASGGVPGGWTEVDHDTRITVGEDSAGLTLTQSSGAASAVGGIYKSIPAGDFTIWTKLSINGIHAANYISGGLALFQDATDANGDIILYQMFRDTSTHTVDITHYSDRDNFSSSLSTINLAEWFPVHIYLRIRRNGTTYNFEFSSDGLGWIRHYSNTIAFTPTHYGLGVGSNNTGANTVMRFPFFRYLASDVGFNGLVGGKRI